MGVRKDSAPMLFFACNACYASALLTVKVQLHAFAQHTWKLLKAQHQNPSCLYPEAGIPSAWRTRPVMPLEINFLKLNKAGFGADLHC